jgi:hypothetical protein
VGWTRHRVLPIAQRLREGRGRLARGPFLDRRLPLASTPLAPIASTYLIALTIGRCSRMFGLDELRGMFGYSRGP